MHFLRTAMFLALSALIVSCGGTGEDSPGTGGISFDLSWAAPAAPGASKSLFAPAPDVCNDLGLATITMRVQNTSGDTFAAQSFACSAHTGVLNGIPVGGNYVLIIEGLLANSSHVWFGTRPGLSVTAGQTTAAGTIAMTYTGTDTTPPTILATSPTATATGVPVTSPVTATFSENMAISSVNETNFTVSQGAAPVAGAVTYDAANRTATFTPSTNLAYGTTYSAWIKSSVTDMAMRSLTGSNNVWSFTTEAAPVAAPSAPAGFAATGGDTTVSLSWNAASGATSYTVYWGPAPGVTKFSPTKITNITGISTVHTGRSNGTTYYYVITASNGVGESVISSEVNATPTASGGFAPAAPTGVTATPGYQTSTISWSAVSVATSYKLYWSTTGGVSTLTGTVISNVTSPFIHSGRTNGTTYYYVVTAVNSGGQESIASAEVSATYKAHIRPVNDSINVPVSDKVYADFFQPMNAATINASNFFLTRTTDSAAIPATVSYDQGLNFATLLPSTSLSYSTSYTAVLNGIKDANGNSIHSISTFVTQSQPSALPPKIANGCFIATAAYGSDTEPEVQALRNFRDRYLLTNGTGRALVAVYYHYSPAAAKLLNSHPAFKPAVRAMLLPVVMMAGFLTDAPGPAMTAMLLLMSFLIILLAARNISGRRKGAR